MGLKITFINPNSERDVDKYLPKILAAALMNMLVGSQANFRTEGLKRNEKHPA